ncbi:MAG: hypothetical protein ACRCX7_10870 [Cetobacterium sp.]|uniref:hypothetical protein n=1 Tax=Cetobacterium sp. TaxID=2071632 RepID=UPI003F3A3748
MIEKLFIGFVCAVVWFVIFAVVVIFLWTVYPSFFIYHNYGYWISLMIGIGVAWIGSGSLKKKLK